MLFRSKKVLLVKSFTLLNLTVYKRIQKAVVTNLISKIQLKFIKKRYLLTFFDKLFQHFLFHFNKETNLFFKITLIYVRPSNFKEIELKIKQILLVEIKDKIIKKSEKLSHFSFKKF